MHICCLRLPEDISFLRHYVFNLPVSSKWLFLVQASKPDLIEELLSEDQVLLKHIQHYRPDIYVLVNDLSPQQIFFSFNICNCRQVISTYEIHWWRAFGINTFVLSFDDVATLITKDIALSSLENDMHQISLETCLFHTEHEITHSILEVINKHPMYTYLICSKDNITLNKRLAIVSLLAQQGLKVLFYLDDHIASLWNTINHEQYLLKPLHYTYTQQYLIKVNCSNTPQKLDQVNLILNGKDHELEDWVTACSILQRALDLQYNFILPIKVQNPIKKLPFALTQVLHTVLKPQPICKLSSAIDIVVAGLTGQLYNYEPLYHLLPLALLVDQLMILPANQKLGLTKQFELLLGNKTWHMIPIEPYYHNINCRNKGVFNLTNAQLPAYVKPIKPFNLLFCGSKMSWSLLTQRRLIEKVKQYPRQFILVVKQCINNPLLPYLAAVIYDDISDTAYQQLIMFGVVPLRLKTNKIICDHGKNHKVIIDFAKLQPKYKIKIRILVKSDNDINLFPTYDLKSDKHHAIIEQGGLIWAAPDSNWQPTDYESGALPLS